MATTLISVEEYLHTRYEPDAEYVDGVVEERAMGEGKHSEWQGTLSFFFKAHRHEWEIRIRPEFRTQTGERRYRVPDLAVVEAVAAEEQIAVTPPLIAFEILSPEDRLSRLLVRLADFEAMGVPAIYVIDPLDNSLLRFKNGRLDNVNMIFLRELAIPFVDILAELD